MALMGLALRAKRDPEGTRNYLDGYYVSICCSHGWEKGVEIVATELNDEFPMDCLPDTLKRDLLRYVRQTVGRDD